MYYVRIDSLTDSQIEFCGFTCVYEDVDHKLYSDYYGDEYIVPNKSPRYLKVDDLNDANCLRSAYVIQVEPEK